MNSTPIENENKPFFVKYDNGKIKKNVEVIKNENYPQHYILWINNAPSSATVAKKYCFPISPSPPTPIKTAEEIQTIKWTFKSETYALADTGDYEGYIQFTNGRDIWKTCGDEISDEECQQFCDLLNLMPDLWSHVQDNLEFQISELSNSRFSISSKKAEEIFHSYFYPERKEPFPEGIPMSNDNDPVKKIALKAMHTFANQQVQAKVNDVVGDWEKMKLQVTNDAFFAKTQKEAKAYSKFSELLTELIEKLKG